MLCLESGLRERTEELDIDLVVVNYKKYGLTSKFLKSFYKFHPSSDCSMTVVNNSGHGPSSDLLQKQFDKVSIIDNLENWGYGKACNQGAQLGNSRYIGLFNNDVQFVNDTCVDATIKFLDDNPDVGVAGPLQYTYRYGRKKITNAGIVGSHAKPNNRSWMKEDFSKYRVNEEVLSLMGAALFIRREYWDKLSQDPTYLSYFPKATGAMAETKLYYEDTILCYAAPLFGYKVFFLGEERFDLVHDWHQTIKSFPHMETTKEVKKIFQNIMSDWGIDV